MNPREIGLSPSVSRTGALSVRRAPFASTVMCPHFGGNSPARTMFGPPVTTIHISQ